MLTRKVAGRVYNCDYCVGRAAGGGAGFGYPADFALGSGDSLYVTNRSLEFMSGHGICKVTLDHEFLWEDRGAGFAGGESPWPAGIDVDSAENVYVSDDHVHRIFIYDKGGTLLGSWGKPGSGDGELNSPTGLAFDAADNLYVVDGLNHRVQKFTRDGRFLGKWGSLGSGPDGFNMPWGVAIDSVGSVYVADWKNGRVQKFTPEGRYLATFGRPGMGDGELSRPTDVAVDDEGDVYVTDWGNHRLNIYAADGTFITAFIGDAEILSPWCQDTVDANPDYLKARRRADLTPEWRFERPVAVNVDQKGRIMVLEAQRHRIQVYMKERNFVDAQFNL